MTGSLSFNSRTLGRVRRYKRANQPNHERFNSRTLGRVRLREQNNFTQEMWFQFTHPGKGATNSNDNNDGTE